MEVPKIQKICLFFFFNELILEKLQGPRPGSSCQTTQARAGVWMVNKRVFSWSVIMTEGKLLLQRQSKKWEWIQEIWVGGFVKTQTSRPAPRLFDSVGHGWAWEPALLTRFQVTFMLLVWGLHFKDDWPNGKRQGSWLTEHRAGVSAPIRYCDFGQSTYFFLASSIKGKDVILPKQGYNEIIWAHIC